MERIENGGRGLNLTAEVRDGILCHTARPGPRRWRGASSPRPTASPTSTTTSTTPSAPGVLDEDDLPASTHALLGPDHSSRIQTLVLDMVETSAAADDIRMSGAW